MSGTRLNNGDIVQRVGRIAQQIPSPLTYDKNIIPVIVVNGSPDPALVSQVERGTLKGVSVLVTVTSTGQKTGTFTVPAGVRWIPKAVQAQVNTGTWTSNAESTVIGASGQNIVVDTATTDVSTAAYRANLQAYSMTLDAGMTIAVNITVNAKTVNGDALVALLVQEIQA